MRGGGGGGVFLVVVAGKVRILRFLKCACLVGDEPRHVALACCLRELASLLFAKFGETLLASCCCCSLSCFLGFVGGGDETGVCVLLRELLAR